MSAAQVALAYILAKPAVTSVIVGARTEEQLRDNLGAAELRRPTTSWSGWTTSASCRCAIRTGTRRTPPDRLSPADLSLLARHLSG